MSVLATIALCVVTFIVVFLPTLCWLVLRDPQGLGRSLPEEESEEPKQWERVPYETLDYRDRNKRPDCYCSYWVACPNHEKIMSWRYEEVKKPHPKR